MKQPDTTVREGVTYDPAVLDRVFGAFANVLDEIIFLESFLQFACEGVLLMESFENAADGLMLAVRQGSEEPEKPAVQP